MSFRIKENWFHDFENSAVIFFCILVLELLFDKTDIDIMMLFKFDFNDAILSFKTIVSMKFSFDLNLILIWSRNYVLFKWNVKNGYQKNLKKFSFMSFDRSRIPFDRSNVPFNRSNRNRESIENQSSHPEICDEFLQFFDRSRIPFNWSDVPFDRSNRNRESIKSSKNFKMDLLNISIDREIPSIDRTYCFWYFTKC